MPVLLDEADEAVVLAGAPVAPEASEEAVVADWREDTALPEPWQFAPFSQQALLPSESVVQ